MKKLLSLSAALLTAAMIGTGAAAQSTVKIVDDADLFTQTQEEIYTEMIDQLVLDYGVDAMICTTDTLYGTEISEYAADTFDEYGCGIGNDRDGIILVICIDEDDRKVRMSTHGWAKEYAFTQYGTDRIIELIKPFLSDDKYNEAATEWLRLSDEFLAAAEKEAPYSEEHKYLTTTDILIKIALAFGIGLAVALVVCLILRSTMKTAVHQRNAVDYVKPNSFSVTKQRDIFVYSTITRTERVKNDSSSSGNSSQSSDFGGSEDSF